MLAALALVTAGLLALGPLPLVLPRPFRAPASRALIHWGTAALCGTGLALSLAGLVAGTGGTLALPVGLPGADGGGMRLAFDGLTGFALPPVFLCGAAAAVCASVPGRDAPGRDAPDRDAPDRDAPDRDAPDRDAPDRDAPDRDAPAAAALAALVGCMALALLAADGFTLLLGFEGMLVASWCLASAGADRGTARPPATPRPGVALFGGVCLVAAMGVLGTGTDGFGPAFAGVRAAPPEGWQAAAVLGLAVSGAGSRALVVPTYARAAAGHAGALLSGAVPGVAAYVLIRVLFDLCGPVTPSWWGAPVLALGAVCAVSGALRAGAEPDLAGVLAAGSAANLGLAAMGAGVALAARGTDLPPLASLALGGVLLHLLAYGVFGTLLPLCAGAMEHGAGSRELSRLGGLVHRMPATSLCALVGAASFALLPPGAGFAGSWVLLQSLLAAPRVGGPAWQIAAATAAVAAGAVAALLASAAVRLVGLAVLGRPRTPRAAAAEEAPRRVRLVLAALAVLAVLLGLLPGAALRLADPAMRALVGTEPAGMGSVLVAPEADAPGYSAPGLAALLAAAGLAVAWVARARMVRGERRGPAWEGGLGAASAGPLPGDAPAWYGAASMAWPATRGSGPFPGVREGMDAPPLPGRARPGRMTRPHDPARVRLRLPLRRLSRWLVRTADRARCPTPGQSLAVTVSTLALLLALTAWAGGR